MNSEQKLELETEITKEVEQFISNNVESRINKLFAGTTRINASKI